MSKHTDVALSISDKALGDGDLQRELQTLREYGFTHVHFSQMWRKPEPLDQETIERWQEALAASGMAVLDVHGIHPPKVNLWDEDPNVRELAFELFVHRLELTYRLGGDAIVYHVPTRVEADAAVIDRYIDGLARLEDQARELGIKVAIENHYRCDNDRITLTACFERFSPDYVGLTFDSGHAIRSGNTEWLIANCFDRLVVLHLHDNEPEQDRHWVPGAPGGHVDWDQVAAAIAASPYRKPVQLETGWDRDRYPEHGEFLRSAYAAAISLHERIEALRAGN